MMADRIESLFVYGTLMPGYGNHRRIVDHVRSARPATVQGILVDLGAFPALIRGHGKARGVLLAIDPHALAITDLIEGFHPDRARSLYVREEVEIDLGKGSKATAWTYFFAKPDRIQHHPQLIVGDAADVPIYSWPAE
jgi:gamma-glutamylcyclotransferase (GGCT)/AIG2-like uncharacterized protein YtfP